MASPALQLNRWLTELGRISDEPGQLTRTFLSPAMARANARVAVWMREAGLTVRWDRVGNLIGRWEAVAPVRRGGVRRSARPKTLLLGSHLDTVRNAGRFDGPLGVLLPIAAVAALRRRDVVLPFHVEVLGFSEEEGVRFASGYLGSKGYCGQLTAADLALRDAEGISVGEAIAKWNGLTPGNPDQRVGVNALHLQAAHRRRDLLGYVEVHIEQGPVLEERKLAVGVVSAIAGQSRFKLTWTGQAGHAGTTPMALRRDALAGVAEFAVAVEALARRTPGLVATIGAMAVSPGASNVIPGRVLHTLDVRHASDAVRKKALLALGRAAAKTARARQLTCRWQRTQHDGAVNCSPTLTAQLEKCVRAVQGQSRSLVSGAGHDAVVMAKLAPVAMLFVRCRAGLSHHPDEFASPGDIEVALRVMVDFLQALDG